MAKKTHNTGFRVIKGGDSLYTQKYVTLYRHRQDGKIVDGFYAVGSMLNKVKKLKHPFVRWNVTNNLDDAFNYAIRHLRAWKIPRLKIEPELMRELEKSENWSTIQHRIEGINNEQS